ncbi:hypothetical protein CD798_08035 [Bacillaceae bacterium SAOS 7]|nr:hypothetical protein CD798_08035 [Bacillaceae bacterium SAOS 7]
MNIHEALKGLPETKKQYFMWKHDIRYDRTIPKKTEKEFLKIVERKTLNSFVQWERSQEYKYLLALLLDSKIANDMDKIYKIVVDNAMKGEEKHIRLFLSMQKDIQSNAKEANKLINKVEKIEKDEQEDYEEIGLDLS